MKNIVFSLNIWRHLSNNKNQIFVFLSKIFGAGLAIGLNVAITRSLPIESAGSVFLSISIVTIIYALARLGFGYTTAKLVALYANRGDYGRLRGAISVALEAVSLSSLVFGILLYLSPHIPNLDKYFDGEMRDIVPIFAICVPVFCCGSIAAEILKGLRRPFEFSLIDSVVPKLISAPLVLLLSKWWGTSGVAWAYFSGILLTAILAFFLAYKSVSRAIINFYPVRERRSIYISAIYFSILSYGTVIGQWATPLIVGYQLSKSDSALYFTSYRTAAVVEFVLLSAAAVIGPLFIKVFEEGGMNDLYRSSFKFSIVTFLSAGLIACPLLLLAPWVMSIYGPDFSAANLALRILVIAHWISAPFGVFLYTLIALGKERVVAITTPIAVSVGLLIVFIMSRNYGLTGAAIGQATFIIGQNILIMLVCLGFKRRQAQAH